MTIDITRPICKCGGFAILGKFCATCFKENQKPKERYTTVKNGRQLKIEGNISMTEADLIASLWGIENEEKLKYNGWKNNIYVFDILG